MIKINLCIDDWKSYNEGNANWKWFTLPTQEGELLDHLDTMNEQGLDEPFICDYEAPFKIDEHARIGNLVEIAYFNESELLETLDENELDEVFPIDELETYLGSLDPADAFYRGKFSNLHSFHDYWKLDGYENIQGLTDHEYNDVKKVMLQKAFENFNY